MMDDQKLIAVAQALGVTGIAPFEEVREGDLQALHAALEEALGDVGRRMVALGIVVKHVGGLR